MSLIDIKISIESVCLLKVRKKISSFGLLTMLKYEIRIVENDVNVFIPFAER